MNSFWIDNFKNKLFESLDQNLKTDVCIIGGGITGISCGYYLSRAGLNVCILEKDKINLPVKNIKIALEFSHQAQFNPIKYALSLCDYITKNKGIIFENSKVVGLKKSGNEYNINCNNHLVTAKYVIIATRYPIINFPGFYFLKMYSETSNLIALETTEPLFNDMYINEDTPTFSFRTAIYNGKRILLVGGFNHKTGSKIDLNESYNLLEQQALKMYPNSKVLYKWNTHDSISLDKLPYIGDFSNLYPNVYVATGFKKWGMTTSNVAANIISDKILKKGNAYADIYKATRLKPIKNRKELGNIIKETSHSLIFNKFDLPSATPKDVKNDDGKIINYKRKKDWIIQK